MKGTRTLEEEREPHEYLTDARSLMGKQKGVKRTESSQPGDISKTQGERGVACVALRPEIGAQHTETRYPGHLKTQGDQGQVGEGLQ